MSDKALPPQSVIGILGGGQLARMLALAAVRLGLKTHIYYPDPESPAFDVSAQQTIAAYDDLEAARAFAASVDVVTYEFENVPAELASVLEEKLPLYPNAEALRITQDRLLEKTFIQEAEQPVGAFKAVDSLEGLREALEVIRCPCVLKTRRFGYDGKGQTVIQDLDDAERAWQDIGEQPAILEAFVDFEREVSLIVARSQKGEIVCYDVLENEHENHILRKTRIAGVTQELDNKAKAIGKHLAEELDYVGVMAVEMFVVRDHEGKEDILVNEIAPRVHNSGHITEALCFCSQFEQHIRAIAGWPLGSVMRHSNGEMENILGFEHDDWLKFSQEAGVLHLYGKKETRDGRKMGHITRVE